MEYNTMYAKLFNAITDAVRILQQVQSETEEMYIKQEPINLRLIRPDIECSNDGDDE